MAPMRKDKDRLGRRLRPVPRMTMDEAGVVWGRGGELWVEAMLVLKGSRKDQNVEIID